MGRLEAALARFDAALDALEKGAAESAASRSNGEAAAKLEHELAELNREREGLNARISMLEEESQSLAGLTEAVETRLDGAIAEIRAALGRG